MPSIGSRSSPKTIWSPAASRCITWSAYASAFRWSCTASRSRSAAPIPSISSILRTVRALAARIEPHWISDHLCWTGVEGRNLHDLLPLPYTEEALASVVARVGQVQDALGRQILLENVSSYLTFHASEMSEWEFLREVASARRLRHPARHQQYLRQQRQSRLRSADYLQAMPKSRVRQFHLAGHSDMGGHLIDTHDHPIVEPGLGSVPRRLSRTSARCRP